MASRRVAVLMSSSHSGRACTEVLARALQSGDHHIASLRAVFRSEAARDAVVGASAALPKLQATAEAAAKFASTQAKRELLELHVGADASDGASLRAALREVDAAVLVTPHGAGGFGEDAPMSRAMVEAALEEGVQRIVHVGSWTCGAPQRLPALASRFHPVEEFLRDDVKDAADWTVLRGGYFVSNLALLFGAAVRAGGAVALPRVAVAPVDVRDIGAAAAALCLHGPEEFRRDYHGRFLECSGPAQLSLPSALGESLARHLPAAPPCEEVDVESWCDGKPPFLQELLRYMHAEQEGAVPYEPQTLAQLLGREPAGLDDWVDEHVRLFRPEGDAASGGAAAAPAPARYVSAALPAGKPLRIRGS